VLLLRSRPFGCGITYHLPRPGTHLRGEWIKTDRRDANNLAKLHRAGELTAAGVPDQAHEAIRDPRVETQDNRWNCVGVRSDRLPLVLRRGDRGGGTSPSFSARRKQGGC